MPAQKEKAESPRGEVDRGVPLGGVGAGAIEFGRDGRLRNLSLNNNRTRDSAIPLAENSFAAVHVAQAGRAYPLVLQQALDEPREAEEAPRLAGDGFHWRGLYPTAHFQLRDKTYPAQVVMSAFAPVIPYDHDASSMPVLCVSIRLANRTQEPIDVSVLLNIDNLCGRTGADRPAACPPAAPAVVEESDEIHQETETASTRKKEKGLALGRRPTRAELERTVEETREDDAGKAPEARFNAVEFGSPTDPPSSAHGHYCLAVRRRPSFAISTLVWDPEDAADHAAFWQSFKEDGSFPKGFHTAGEPRAGAVCCQFKLGPRYEQRVDFIFAWYCPRFEVHGVDLGNGYTNRFRNANEVARQAMRHYQYYIRSVEDWLGRVMSASLPHWFNRLLANSCYVFSTNTLYTRRGVFAMMESTDAPLAERLDRRLYWSLGTLLFFPRFEHAALRQLGSAASSAHPQMLCKGGRELDPESHDFDGAGPLQTELCAQFVLSAYRNYRFSGNLAHIQALFPRIQAVMAAVAGQDRDGDGLPEPGGTLTLYDGCAGDGLHSPAAGLWVAALAAYGKLADYLDAAPEAARARRMQARAAASFEHRYWCEAAGHYRLFPARAEPGAESEPPVCHSAQLTGQWYADLLGLGPLFNPEHISRALSAIVGRNGQRGALASAVASREMEDAHLPAEAGLAWPALTLAHCVCPLLYRDRVNEALALVKHLDAEESHGSRYRFDQFLKHVPETLDPAPGNLHRHAYSLSIWYVYYALQGFELAAVEGRVRVAPHLPQGVYKMSAPLFTTSCLGWLQYKESPTAPYRQRIRLSFDSPVPVRTIELRVPGNVPAFSVQCEHPDEQLDWTHTVESGETGKRLLIWLNKAIIVTESLRVNVDGEGEEAEEAPVSAEPPTE